MREIEQDPAELSIEDLKEKIASKAKILFDTGHLPSGLTQLFVGSLQYRKKSLFYESGANQGYYSQDPELEPLWNQWAEEYDGFSADNLAETLRYQHRDSQQNIDFPDQGTSEYERILEQTGELGMFVKEYFQREDWEKTKKMLLEFDSWLNA